MPPGSTTDDDPLWAKTGATFQASNSPATKAVLRDIVSLDSDFCSLMAIRHGLICQFTFAPLPQSPTGEGTCMCGGFVVSQECCSEIPAFRPTATSGHRPRHFSLATLPAGTPNLPAIYSARCQTQVDDSPQDASAYTRTELRPVACQTRRRSRPAWR